ncbi:MAG: hypothetical protein BMS9Abin25_1175 [Gammaproteobacteria bacterium]|nr:MAG: hypothetical protein BMS9Abin25_1175 [Gammaproteobacteria bacterium]
MIDEAFVVKALKAKTYLSQRRKDAGKEKTKTYFDVIKKTPLTSLRPSASAREKAFDVISYAQKPKPKSHPSIYQAVFVSEI